MAQRHDKRRVGAIGTAALLALQFRQKLRLLVQFLRESLDLRLKALGRIDRGGCVVEDEHSGIGEDRPRDCNPLALSARQRKASFAQHRLVPVRELGNEAGRSGKRGGAGHGLVVSIGSSEADVLPHALREQKCLFEDECDGAAHVGEPELADVVSVQQDAAAVRVVQARE